LPAATPEGIEAKFWLMRSAVIAGSVALGSTDVVAPVPAPPVGGGPHAAATATNAAMDAAATAARM
jgi:hypothetical protein